MADRLSELARQRALLSEHLAWLDREIANETVKRIAPTTLVAPVVPVVAGGTSGSSIPSAPIVSEPLSGFRSEPTAPAAAAENILDQYRVSPTSVKQDVRKGCLLYFAAAFILLGLVVAVLYLTISSHAGD